ncbi:hypothetical protein [Streptomyces phaeolivaceus]|uniref:hypothetical protein n=1 Tax=Streptomyces phaeolivaceus TaxID=2653200 RepID=UPI00186AA30A|nr:hypothetical protein [Streptomyces phaeolivaceus]
MNTSARRRLTAAVLTVVTVTAGATACSSGGGDTSTKAEDGGTYTIWDPYPQYNGVGVAEGRARRGPVRRQVIGTPARR